MEVVPIIKATVQTVKDYNMDKILSPITRYKCCNFDVD